MAIETEIIADEQEAAAAEVKTRSLRRSDLMLIVVATLAITAVMFIFGLWGSGWHLASPLDDTFIHLQYARQLVAGHPFQYNTGDPPSSGDSAFLYPFMLAPAFVLGLDGMKALLYADVLGLVAHLACALLLYALATRLGGRMLGLLAAVFFLLDGSLNWSFVTGMETGIYTAGLVLIFWLWQRDVRFGRLGWFALASSLVALIRPEGHVLVSIVCLLTIAYLWRNFGLSPKYALLLLPPLVGLVPYAVNIAITGTWQYNTAASKSIWYVPYSPLREKVSLTAGYFITVVKDIYLGLEIGRSPFPLLALPLAVLGAASGLADRRYRFLHVLLITTFLGGVGLALLLPPLHFYRYNQPYDPLYILYIALGAIALARFAARIASRVGEVEFTALPTRYAAWAGVAIAGMLLPQFLSYFFAFGDSNRDIYYQQMTFSDWIRKYTPADARIGVNDTGAHKYLGNRYIVDLIGLTDNYLRGAYFSGWGTIFDRLYALPEDQRPTYFLIHPNVFLNGIDESVSQSLLTPVYSVRVQAPIITAGDTETLYKVNWEYALLDPTKTYLVREGQQPLDQINIGDVTDEQAHKYNEEGREPSISEPKSIVSTAAYEAKGFSLSDSGRRHSGWEQFTVKSVPGKGLALVSRSRLNPKADQQLLVWANGKQVGVWKVHNDRGAGWQEYEYNIPAQFITGNQTTIRIDATFDPGGPGFATYRYWVYGE